jgi:hypothetical protein
MQFYIRFRDEVTQADGETFEVGEIKIADFTESFHSATTYWNKNDYLNQWKKALERIRQGFESSCFITSMCNPLYANFIFWWVVYIEGDWAHIQNHIFFLNELSEPFQVDKIYSYIQKREIYNEDGNKISEWKIRIEEIESFIASIQE